MCVCRLMLHSGPVKPHLPCSLRCCCLSAVSAYQVQLADCADAMVASDDRTEKTANILIICIALLFRRGTHWEGAARSQKAPHCGRAGARRPLHIPSSRRRECPTGHWGTRPGSMHVSADV